MKKLSTDKSGGENGVIPEMVKALMGENRMRVYDYLVQFWEGEVDYESWHSGLLCIIHKTGRAKDDPNNFRGINLMDVFSKVMSIILNKRLFMILDKYGTEYQFGGRPNIGCREGVYTIKTMLDIRRNHNLGTHICFVDLVKAYDTANHELLLAILENTTKATQRHQTSLH